jgi:hypothetical protein
MLQTLNVTLAMLALACLGLLFFVAAWAYARGYSNGKEDGASETYEQWEEAVVQLHRRTAGDIVREKQESGAGSRDGRDSSGLANRGRTRPT